jgi:hypothetical protein
MCSLHGGIPKSPDFPLNPYQHDNIQNWNEIVILVAIVLLKVLGNKMEDSKGQGAKKVMWKPYVLRSTWHIYNLV